MWNKQFIDWLGAFFRSPNYLLLKIILAIFFRDSFYFLRAQVVMDATYGYISWGFKSTITLLLDRGWYELIIVI